MGAGTFGARLFRCQRTNQCGPRESNPAGTRRPIYSRPRLHSGLCPHVSVPRRTDPSHHAPVQRAACGSRTRLTGVAIRCLCRSAKAAQQTVEVSIPARPGLEPELLAGARPLSRASHPHNHTSRDTAGRNSPIIARNPARDRSAFNRRSRRFPAPCGQTKRAGTLWDSGPLRSPSVLQGC